MFLAEALQGEFLFTVGAVVLWAASTPVISYALEGCRKSDSGFSAVLVGLNTALITGFLVLTLIRGLPAAPLFWDPLVFMAGLLTFPIGTGLYYTTSILNQNRAALAAQFANVKPILTIFAGVILFSEVLDWGALVAVVLITIGIGMMVWSASKNASSFKPLIFGLLLAGTWGAGEIFVKEASLRVDRFDVAHASLGASIPFALLASYVLIKYVSDDPLKLPSRPVLLAFGLHGLFSFAGAYVFYFASISEIGLANTALAVSFWPLLGLVFASIFNRRVLSNVPAVTLIAMTLFFIGALVHIGF